MFISFQFRQFRQNLQLDFCKNETHNIIMDPNNLNSVPPPPQIPVEPIPSPQLISKNNRTFTILLLLFINPVGVIYMWFKSSWNLHTKVLITFFSIIFVFIPAVLGIMILITVNPIGMYKNALDAQRKSQEIQDRMKQEINSVNQQKKQFPVATIIPTSTPTGIPSTPPSLSPTIIQTNSTSTILLPSSKSPTPQASGSLTIKIIQKDDSYTFISFSGTFQNLPSKRFYDLNVCTNETNCTTVPGYIIKTDAQGNATINNQLGKIPNSFITSNTILKITEEVVNPSDPQTCPSTDAACLEGKFVTY